MSAGRCADEEIVVNKPHHGFRGQRHFVESIAQTVAAKRHKKHKRESRKLHHRWLYLSYFYFFSCLCFLCLFVARFRVMLRIMADILVVDDDDVIRDTLCELLAVDHNCEQAKTAEEALRKLAARSFDVVLTDITMPGLSGSELLTRVLERYPGTPVIMVSGLIHSRRMSHHERGPGPVFFYYFKSDVAPGPRPLLHQFQEPFVRRILHKSPVFLHSFFVFQSPLVRHF